MKIMERCNNIEDYSYGLYIYAWPIQQTIVYFIKNISVYEVFFLTLLVIITLAFLSKHWIENPVLKWEKSLNY